LVVQDPDSVADPPAFPRTAGVDNVTEQFEGLLLVSPSNLQMSVKELLPLFCNSNESQVGSLYERSAACDAVAMPIARKNNPAIGRVLQKR
jgi:hypothetical protein